MFARDYQLLHIFEDALSNTCVVFIYKNSVFPSKRLESIGKYFPSQGILGNFAYLFCTQVVSKDIFFMFLEQMYKIENILFPHIFNIEKFFKDLKKYFSVKTLIVFVPVLPDQRANIYVTK